MKLSKKTASFFLNITWRLLNNLHYVHNTDFMVDHSGTIKR